jgi:diadenylate cyclase
MQIVQVSVLFYSILWLWKRIAGTHAERLVKGVIVLLVIASCSYLLRLTIITSLLMQLLPIALIGLVVIFQPEIRKGLGYLGKLQTLRLDLFLVGARNEKLEHDIDQIVTAVKELSRNRFGAIIVIEPPEGEREYLSPGTLLNAEISSNLILSIFFPKSPLHDGALVIRQEKITAAGVILPMSDNPKLSYKYGTRHRAAIGLSELYDGLSIVVSEETGAISAASRGMLARYRSAEELAEPIKYLYRTGVKESGPILFSSWFSNIKSKVGTKTINVISLGHFSSHREADQAKLKAIADQNRSTDENVSDHVSDNVGAV